MYIKNDNEDTIRISDKIIRILLLVFMLIVLIGFVFPHSAIVATIPYLSVLIEIGMSVYLLYYDNWEMSSNIEGYIAIIYLVSTLFFTLMHVGIVSAVTAVCKEYFILFKISQSIN